MAWDYALMPSQDGIAPELYMSLVGARKPVLFIEGDSRRSIDARLYPLIFPDFTVRSLGSCNKVIESTRTFNGLASFHSMDSFGIVDRDRRDDQEVEYLRSKRVMVPDVAEIENMFLIEDVVRAMATVGGHDAVRAVAKVKRTVIALFKADVRQQALQHTRHYMKRMMERRVDGRFPDIATLENTWRVFWTSSRPGNTTSACAGSSTAMPIAATMPMCCECLTRSRCLQAAMWQPCADIQIKTGISTVLSPFCAPGARRPTP